MNKGRSGRFFAKGVAALVALAAVSLLVVTTITTVFCDGYSSGLRFTSNGDGTCIVSRGSCTDTDIVIPERSPSNDVVVEIGAFGESFNSDDGNIYGEDYVIDDVFDMSGAGTQRVRIESVTIPSTVNTISACAFESCKNLTDIYYQGSPAGWAAITKGAGWNYGAGNYEITFSVTHNHVPVTDPAVAATCTSTGLTAGSHCSVCEEVLVAQTVVPMIAHTEVTDPAVAPTCTATGLSQGKHCSVCGTVLVEQQTVPMIDHAEATDPMVPATCTETGLTSGKHCSVCGLVIVAQEVIPAVGHNYIADVTAPTCTEGGYTTYTCDNCGDSYVANETSALGHAVVVDAAIAPTCTATGLTEGSHCSRCNTVLTAQSVVPATGHTEAVDAAIAPTCTETGLTEGKHCSVCGTVLIAQTVVPATGHTEAIDAAVAPTCTETGLTAGSHCSVCGAVLTAQETVPAVGHVWDYGVITVEPTTTSVGEKTYTCTVCGDTYTVDVPKISEGWDGTVADDFDGGKGTESSPYRIATPAQWAYFAQYVYEYEPHDEYFVLTADLYFNDGDASEWGTTAPENDLTDYMVGTWDYPFIGYFDGQGHKLSGVYMSTTGDSGTGIFGATANHETAVIRNLIVENSYIYSDGCTVGTVVGQCRAGSTTLENIYVTDTVKVVCGKYGTNNDSYAGGVVGHFSKNSAPSGETLELVVTSCVNGASVTAQGRSVGGIVGNGNGNNVYATDCLNYGAISGANYVGGIVGYNTSSGSTVDRCVNIGTITGSNRGEITVSTSSSKKPRVTDCLALSTSYGANLNSSGCDVITIDAFLTEGFLDTDEGGILYDYWAELSYDTSEGHVNDICVPYSLYDAFSGNIPQSSLAVVEIASNIMMLPGASVRFNEPTGIRFIGKFNKDYIDGLGDEIASLGVIIAPEIYVSTAGEFTIEALDALSDSIGKTTRVIVDNSGDGFKFSNASTAETDGFYTFNAVLGNMRENNYEVQFSAISFVELTDGTIIYSAYEPTKNCRNISTVSRAAYDDVVILDTNEGISGYRYFVEEVEVDNVTKYKYSPYSQTKRNLLFDFFKGDLLEIIADIFSTTKTPTEYTVGEDRYDIDCTAYRFDDTTKAEFDAFIVSMRNIGYTLHATNGEDGINELCYQATLYNSRYTVNITYFSQTEETFITVEAFRAVSPLQVKPAEQYYGDNVYFHEPKHPNNSSGSYAFGEMDIFQLSNNHFVIVDGAQEYSSQMLVEYLENIVGPGNTPIIEAWFFTHAHPDHIYCAWGVGRDDDLVSRIKVNGFYYTWPNDSGVRKESDYAGLVEQIGNLNSVIDKFRTEDGRETPRYKIHAGMTFYINEVKVEVLLTQDQLMPSEYQNGFNDSSTSYKFTVYTTGGVESTFLIMGDAYTPVCEKLMEKYDYNTLHTTFFTSLHHGNNDVPNFFQFIAPDYIIYTAPSYNPKNKPGYSWLDSNCLGRFKAPTTIKLPC